MYLHDLFQYFFFETWDQAHLYIYVFSNFKNLGIGMKVEQKRMKPCRHICTSFFLQN